jgi:hypothetical protein
MSRRRGKACASCGPCRRTTAVVKAPRPLPPLPTTSSCKRPAPLASRPSSRSAAARG